MKFRHVNVKNVSQLVPAWAIDPYTLAKNIERHLDSDEGRILFPKGSNVFSKLNFWVEVDAATEKPTIRFAIADEDLDLSGNLIITANPVIGSAAQIVVPLNPILKGYPKIEGKHVVYAHSFQTDVPLAYVGVSKQPWFKRFSQHISSAKSRSKLLFHQALIQHQDKPMLHRVFFCELDTESAMEIEEEFVENMSLYPLGLNMIPGGYAGIKYLGKLGFSVSTSQDRDKIIEKLVERDTLEGKPNPLCAARWASDPDFAERVICGHSGRLTGEQVRNIRRLASFGKSATYIANAVNSRNLQQVLGVISNKTYSRVK